MMNKYGYLENIKAPMKDMKKTLDYNHLGDIMGDSWNHSDDEMSFITYYVLEKYAFDIELRKVYK
mgnify:FL=1